MSISKQPSIAELADIIKENTNKYEKYLISKGLQLPSHNASTESPTPFSVKLPQEIVVARDAAVNASQELSLLLEGPARNIISGTSEVRARSSYESVIGVMLI